MYPISCNLSRHQISRPDLIYILCDIVDEYGVDHSLIDFEITESADFADVQYLIEVLNQLKDKGYPWMILELDIPVWRCLRICHLTLSR